MNDWNCDSNETCKMLTRKLLAFETCLPTGLLWEQKYSAQLLWGQKYSEETLELPGTFPTAST